MRKICQYSTDISWWKRVVMRKHTHTEKKGSNTILCISRHLPQSWWSWTSVIWTAWRTWWLRWWSVTAAWMCWSVTAAWSWRLPSRVPPWNWTETSWTLTTSAPALWLKVSKITTKYITENVCVMLVLSDLFYLKSPNNVAGVLPTMISRRSGHIVLVNSIQGRLAIPFRSSCESLWPFCQLNFKSWFNLNHAKKYFDNLLQI